MKVQAGVVVTVTARWIKGPRPQRVSIVIERRWDFWSRRYAGLWTADAIAYRFVNRACKLLRCQPKDLKLRAHPADGFIIRDI